jgi:hypothetical protein
LKVISVAIVPLLSDEVESMIYIVWGLVVHL